MMYIKNSFIPSNLDLLQTNQSFNPEMENVAQQHIEELKSSVLQELSKDLFTNLKQGQSFQGQVTDIQNNIVTIDLGGAILKARIEGMINFSIGDSMKFLVKENNQNHIVISPMIEENIKNMTPEEAAMYKALDAAGLYATDKNIDVVSELIQNRMPVDKQSIQNVLEKVYANPQAKISDLVLMTKYQIPITKENIEQFVNYQNQEQPLTKEVLTLANNLPDILKQVLEPKQDKQTDPILLKQGNEFIDTIQKEMKITKEELPILLKEESFCKELTQHFIKKWTIEAPNINAKEVNEKLGKLMEESEKLTRVLEQMPSEEKEAKTFLQTAQNIKNNLSFMENINENFIYTQLPLKFQNQVTQGELYVYTNKRKKADVKEGIHLFLHLDMENLGSTDIDIYIKNKKLNAKFLVQSQEDVLLLKENIERLEKILEKKGYIFTTQIEEKETKREIDFVKDFLEQGETKTKIKSFSFDRRV